MPGFLSNVQGTWEELRKQFQISRWFLSSFQYKGPCTSEVLPLLRTSIPGTDLVTLLDARCWVSLSSLSIWVLLFSLFPTVSRAPRERQRKKIPSLTQLSTKRRKLSKLTTEHWMYKDPSSAYGICIQLYPTSKALRTLLDPRDQLNPSLKARCKKVL